MILKSKNPGNKMLMNLSKVCGLTPIGVAPMCSIRFYFHVGRRISHGPLGGEFFTWSYSTTEERDQEFAAIEKLVTTQLT